MARRGIGISYVVTGFGLYMCSKPVEVFGDVAPEGSAERLGYHFLALVLVLVAIVMFVKGGISAVRGVINGNDTSPRLLARTFADEPAEPSAFDPDAALARYLEIKSADPSPGAEMPTPHPNIGSLGRKQV